mgnify:CR=1 FL=1
MFFSASFVSSARNVTVSQPKKVSAIKKMVMKMKGRGVTTKGVKFVVEMKKIPGRIMPRRDPRVMNAKVMSMTLLVCMPLYPI